MTKKAFILISFIVFFGLFFIGCGGVSSTTTSTDATTTETTTNSNITTTEATTTEEETTVTTSVYTVSFSTDDHVSVTIYEDANYTTTSSDNSSISVYNNHDVYFTLEFTEGYELDTISIDGSGYDDVDETDTLMFIIENITEDLSVSITSVETVTITEYVATFLLDENVSVTVYDTQDYTSGTVTTIAYARDSDTGEILTDGSGQVNFTVTLAEGYEIDTVTVTPTYNYNNLKDPGDLELDNTYRVTKIQGDITIKITTKVIDQYDEFSPTVITYSDLGVTVDNDNGYVSVESGIVTISLSGDYEITGSISEGALVVSCTDDDVIDLYLYDLSITSTTTAPINVISAGKTEIVIQGTVILTDNRSTEIEETDDTPNAALFSSVDMDIAGTGTLYVYGYYNNGIGTSDDLKLTDITATVIALNNAIKGSDSLTIESGIYDLTAQTGDGLKTSNSDISDKGNQRGIITISGGTITINAGSDGIDAAYDVLIEGSPVITIYTSESYATGVGAAASTSTSGTLYLRISSSISTTYRYAVYFTDASGTNAVWMDADFLTSGYVDGRLYYFYTIDLSGVGQYYTLYQFTSSSTNSTSSYVAKSETSSLNSAYDMLVVGSRDIIGTAISVSWSIYGSSSSTGTEFSTKGIKADNTITINGGAIVIYSYDDGLHANSDVLLETGSYGDGDIIITNGTITITSKDDGIHADSTVSISGGTINVLTAYEGIEGNIIEISGGTSTVVATDDGINATYGSVTPAIRVTGGTLDVTVGSGDTDAIDTNGTYTQTGGFVVSRSAVTGQMGGAIDSVGSVSITGGTFIGIGYSETVTSSTGDNLSTGRISITISGGTYTVLDSSGNTIMTFTTSSAYTYAQIWITSDLFETGSYTLIRNTTTIKTFTFS